MIRLYVTTVDDVKEYVLDDVVKGAHRVKVKYLLHAGVGAKKLQYRLFTIGVGGCTPEEKHDYEHEVYVLQGKALFKGGDKEVICGPESVIFIPSKELHKIKNIGNEPVKFLCTKETHKLPEAF